MKRKLALVLCAILVTSVLMTGCGNKDKGSEANEVNSTETVSEEPAEEQSEEAEKETEKSEPQRTANGDPILDAHDTNEWGYSVSMIASVLELPEVGIASDASMDVAEMMLDAMYQDKGVYGVDSFSLKPETNDTFYAMSLDGILYVVKTDAVGDGLTVTSVEEASQDDYVSLGYYEQSNNAPDAMGGANVEPTADTAEEETTEE